MTCESARGDVDLLMAIAIVVDLPTAIVLLQATCESGSGEIGEERSDDRRRAIAER